MYLNLGIMRGGGLPRSPGIRSGVNISTLVVSRRFEVRPKPASDAAISVTGGEYSQDGGATWTSSPGTRGTFPYLLARGTSSANLLNRGGDLGIITVALIVDGVTYNFVIKTHPTLDLDRNYVSDPPDIGAYEYQG